MKLTGGQAAGFLAKPNADCPGILLFGVDAMRVSLKRQQVIKALVGDKAEEEMRLTRLSGPAVLKDTAQILDGIKAQGFFPGPRVVFVEQAGEGLTETFKTALGEWQPGDATLVVTAGSLKASSKLRKVFEGGKTTVSIGIYDDPPGRPEVEQALKSAGLPDQPQQSMNDLLTLARTLDPGELTQTIEKLALYKIGDDTPVSSDDIAAAMPATSDAELDDASHAIAEGRAGEVGPTLKRLSGQGVTPTALCIAATRHFRTLHAAASSPQGPDAALSRARPPVFGPRKDRLARQARRLGVGKIEKALTELMDTDLTLRSPRPLPDMAVVERAFIRIAMLRRD